MPSTGMSALRASSAARRKVPSPPSTSTSSQPSAASRVGVDHLDVDAQRAHVVGGQMQRSPVDRLGGQHAKANSVVAQHFLHSTGGLGGFLASGVDHQQDGAFSASLRTRLHRTRAPRVPARQQPGRRSVSARSHRKYSTLPDGPGNGLAVTSTVCQPSSPARRATASTELGAQARGRAPPRRRRPDPCPPQTAASPWERYPRSCDAHPVSAGNTVASEMNDRSATMTSTGPPIASGVRSRTLVRSTTTTRGSDAATRPAGRSPRRRRPPRMPRDPAGLR